MIFGSVVEFAEDASGVDGVVKVLVSGVVAGLNGSIPVRRKSKRIQPADSRKVAES